MAVGMTASNAPTEDPTVAVTAPTFQRDNTSSMTFAWWHIMMISVGSWSVRTHKTLEVYTGLQPQNEFDTNIAQEGNMS